jgi:hypothetical protein
MKWRVGEIAEPNAPLVKSKTPKPYEITPVWESVESTAFVADLTVPASAVKVGHTYRTRVRMKDQSGRWSHWSPPSQFTVSPPAN